MAASTGQSDPVEAAAAAADAARDRVTATIDDLQHRLDPRRIVGDAVDRVQTSSRVLAAQAGETVKEHPLAIGAAVGALGLALLARNRLSNATVNLGDENADYTDYDDGYGDEAAYEPMRARLQPLAGKARGSVEANPAVSIVVGLLAGAILGAILPINGIERRSLGQTGNRLTAATRAAARTASQELDAAGLGLDNVRAKAGAATHKAKSAAQSVMDAARAELHPGAGD